MSLGQCFVAEARVKARPGCWSHVLEHRPWSSRGNCNASSILSGWTTQTKVQRKKNEHLINFFKNSKLPEAGFCRPMLGPWLKWWIDGLPSKF